MAQNSSVLLKGKRVLIVDDEPDVLFALQQLLPMCEVELAATFQEAREKLETRSFDIAILDIMGVDGYAILSLAKQKEVLAVMLTAHAPGAQYVVKSFQDGAAFHVPKEEMADMEIFLTDVLEAKERGENVWTRWLRRLGPYYDRTLGSHWKDEHKEFWEKIQY
jgi:DNA-binding NtrC family response regulator